MGSPRTATGCMTASFICSYIPVSSITIPEFMVQKPSCDPVWTFLGVLGVLGVLLAEIPVVAGMFIARLGNPPHGFIF
jgi:hypothetical protein